MKPKHFIPALAAFCLTAHAEKKADTIIVTDPSKIVKSTTYDLGDRLLTVQEVTKEALPMPPPPIPPEIQSAPAPDFEVQPHREFGFLTLGGCVFSRSGQPARTLINFQPKGSDQCISFWTSADWRLIAGVGSLPDDQGKDWELMCLFSTSDEEQQDNSIVIPEFPPGPSTIKIVSGNPTPEQLAPVKLYLSYYDANLPELQAAYNKRVEERNRLAADEKATPKVSENIVVQFRVLAPEEIVPTTTSPKTSEK